MSSQSLIYKVLQKHSIVDYLETHGIFPVKVLAGGKLQYLCPFPDHNENKPSFMVYTESDYENFYCYGCQRNYSIIHLVAGMEGTSFKEALEKLGEGSDAGFMDNLEMEKDRMDKEVDRIKKYRDESLEQVLMSISSVSRKYLESVNYDEKETNLVDRMLCNVDIDILAEEFKSIEDTVKYLPKALKKRKKIFSQKKLEEKKTKLIGEKHGGVG